MKVSMRLHSRTVYVREGKWNFPRVVIERVWTFDETK